MARPHPALFDLATERPMQPVRDFDALLASAVEHRMHGLLWSRVEVGELPNTGEWQRPLAMLSLRSEAHHRRLWNAINVNAEKLAEIGVELAYFKGVVAESRWFARIGQRPSGDIDALLDPAALGRVDEVVRLLSPEHPLIGDLEHLILGNHIHYLELIVDGVNLDLHFDLFKLGLGMDQRRSVWEGCRGYVMGSGREVKILSPELALVQRLLALNRDRFPHLLGYVEVARVAAEDSFDWVAFESLVRDEGFEAPVFGSLAAVGDVLDLPEAAGHLVDHSWRLRIWQVAWSEPARLHGAQARRMHQKRGYVLLPLLIRGRAMDAMRSFWKRLFPPRVVLEYNHPNGSGPTFWRWMVARRSSVWGRQNERPHTER